MIYIYLKYDDFYWANDAFSDIFWGSFWLYLALILKTFINNKLFKNKE